MNLRTEPTTRTLQLNKNKFPEIIPHLLTSIGNDDFKKHYHSKIKIWYQYSFQKNNRWNKSLLIHGIKKYTIQELGYLQNCFPLLFNCNKKYNRAFLNYVDDIIQYRTTDELGLATSRIKISQKGYIELLHFLGEMKRDSKIQSSYKDLVNIIFNTFLPDQVLRPSTISDRLRNKKEYE